MISMSKTEVEQTGRMMDEQQLVIRDLVGVAKLFVERLSIQIEISMQKGDVPLAESLGRSIMRVERIIDRAENGPAWQEKIAAVEHGREMSEILKECNHE